jgi:hypothetical protein
MARAPKTKHARKGNFARLRKSKRALAFLGERALTLTASATPQTFTVVSSDGDNALTITAHGRKLGEGPFVVSTTGALPGGLVANQKYWVKSILSANKLVLSTKLGGPAVTLSSNGTGTHTIKRGVTTADIHALLKQSNSRAVAAATDVDNL